MDWFRWYFGRRAEKYDAPRLREMISKPWDGHNESLPHFYGCDSLFSGYLESDRTKCTCGVNILAQNRWDSLLRFLYCRAKAHAKCLHRFARPSLCWRTRKDRIPAIGFFRDWFRAISEAWLMSQKLYDLSGRSTRKE